MGDQVGVAVSGTLLYVPYKEFERIQTLSLEAVEKTALFAALCRINTLYMIARAGSGHLGSSFSSMDIMCWLQLTELRTPPESDSAAPRDIFFSSKGHDAPGLYSTWIGLGKLDFDLIHQLRRLNGLPGHPDVSTPNVVTNTGSLGMGVSKAKGMIFANRLLKRPGNVYVLTGDGELQEGQFWESLASASNNKLHELIVIIDHNKLQSDTLVAKVSNLGDLEAKLAAFGWDVSRCDGNNLAAFSQTLAYCKTITDKPKVIIADTIKGKGVSFMEHTSIDSDVEFYKFHSGAPTDEAYIKAAQELIKTANQLLAAASTYALELETIIRLAAVQPENSQRLIQAYSHALIEQARKNPKIVALDADLILDTGLIPFQKEFPDRFVECGIAEQDMVSQAGGMALQGLLPIVHSFACFLSTRPNEQIYNNATEKKKIIYVGSLAGYLPAGPGHSHQSVRDISTLGAIPGLILCEPSSEEQVFKMLEWAVNVNPVSTYIRLTSVSFRMPNVQIQYGLPIEGRGVTLIDGSDLVIFAYGPLMINLALGIALRLRELNAISVKVVDFPWLNRIDESWIKDAVSGICHAIALDNHFEYGGQGTMLEPSILRQSLGKIKVLKFGIKDIPPCGKNEEVNEILGMTEEIIVNKILKEIY